MSAATVLLFAVTGTVVGSFVALVSLRWPAGRPVAVSRSACGGCTARLSPGELVPLLSFALQRGRCRRCGAPIPWRYPAIEAGAAAIGAVSALSLPPAVAAPLAALGWALLLLAVLDAEHFWLPSAVTLPLIVAGLAVTAWSRPQALLGHAVGAVAGFAALAATAAAYRAFRGRVGLGGGDARLFAAAGAWLGWEALPLVLGSAAVVGLIVAAALWGRSMTATTRLPLGVFLAAATWIVALATF